jgi:RNA-binding protein
MTQKTEKKKAEPATLSTRQRQFLKGLAHPLNPLVQIGKEGISQGIIDLIRRELDNHELIKVKIGSNSGLEKEETATRIAVLSESTMVQLIGKTIVLYRANPERPADKRIKLPPR